MTRFKVTETVTAYIEAESAAEANEIFANGVGDFVGSHNPRTIVMARSGDKLSNYLDVRLSGEDCTVDEDERAGIYADFKQFALECLERGTSMSALSEALTEVERDIEKGYI